MTSWGSRSTSWRRTRKRRRRCARATRGSRSTSTRTPRRSRPGCSSCGWGIAGTSASWVTRTRPSTPSRGRALSTCADSPHATRGRGSSTCCRTTARARRCLAWLIACWPRPAEPSGWWPPCPTVPSRSIRAAGRRPRRRSPSSSSVCASCWPTGSRLARSRSSSGSTRRWSPSRRPSARAGIPYQVRGQRFFERREVRTAIRALEHLPEELAGEALVAAAREAWRDQLGFDPDEEPEGREARERHAALSTLLAIVTELAGPADGGSPGGGEPRCGPRGAGGAGRGRSAGRCRRRGAAHAAPCQGPGVGCRLHPLAGGGAAAGEPGR